jgi:hypothetical protein
VLTAILQRFRYHGVPGAPGGVAVPLEARASDLEAELTVVFAALEATQLQARQLLASASDRAAETRAQASEQARRLVATAHDHAPPARSAVMTQRLAEVDMDRNRLLALGRAEATRVVQVAEERTPALVSALLCRVFDLAEPGGKRADGEHRVAEEER